MRAAVLLDDRVGDRQAEPGALADVLRREERVEDPRQHLGRQPGPVVRHFEQDDVALAVVPRPHHQRAAAGGGRHRLLGVDHQVQQRPAAAGADRRRRAAGPTASASIRTMLPSRCSCCRSASVSRTTSLTSTVARVECRLRANVSRCRTMRAARSASWRIVSSPCADLRAGLPARHPLGPHQDRGERVVQFVRDAGDRLAEHRHLLGLEQLLVEVARLLLELPALADVAEQRVDLQRVRRRSRLRLAGDLDPQAGRRRRGAAAAGSR